MNNTIHAEGQRSGMDALIDKIEVKLEHDDDMDREKVINGLEHCKIGDCVGCPYDQIREESLHGKHDKWELSCNEQLTEDILSLLKEQEEQIKTRDESLEKAREEIKWLRGMLKEQEVKQQSNINIPSKE